MRNERQDTEKLSFCPLPAYLRTSDPAPGKRRAISGSEEIIDIGALCDFSTERPSIGDSTVHFRVTEYCELDNGLKVEIRDLGFNLSTTLYTGGRAPEPDPTKGLTIESLTEEVRNTTGPEVRVDGSISEVDHDWDELALCAQNAGLQTTGEQLKALGYSITFTDRVRQHIPSTGSS